MAGDKEIGCGNCQIQERMAGDKELGCGNCQIQESMAGDKEVGRGNGPTDPPGPEKRARIHHHRRIYHVMTAIRRKARSLPRHRIGGLFRGK